MKLVYTATGDPVMEGDTVISRTGPATVAQGIGEPPRHAGSTGRIWVTEGGYDGTYFPGVFGCRWTHDAGDQP